MINIQNVNYDILRNIHRTSPNTTDETFSTFTSKDIGKLERLTLLKKLSHDDILNDTKLPKKQILLDAAEELKTEKTSNLSENEKEDFFEQDDFFDDPTKYRLSKKYINDLGASGEYFNSIIISK